MKYRVVCSFLSYFIPDYLLHWNIYGELRSDGHRFWLLKVRTFYTCARSYNLLRNRIYDSILSQPLHVMASWAVSYVKMELLSDILEMSLSPSSRVHVMSDLAPCYIYAHSVCSWLSQCGPLKQQLVESDGVMSGPLHAWLSIISLHWDSRDCTLAINTCSRITHHINSCCWDSLQKVDTNSIFTRLITSEALTALMHRWEPY